MIMQNCFTEIIQIFKYRKNSIIEVFKQLINKGIMLFFSGFCELKTYQEGTLRKVK